MSSSATEGAGAFNSTVRFLTQPETPLDTERELVTARENLAAARAECSSLRNRCVTLENAERSATHYHELMQYFASQLGVRYEAMHTGVGRFSFDLNFMRNPSWARLRSEYANYFTNVPFFGDRRPSYEDNTQLCPVPTGRAGIPNGMKAGVNALAIVVPLRYKGNKFQVFVVDQQGFTFNAVSKPAEGAPQQVLDNPNNTDHAWFSITKTHFITVNSSAVLGEGSWIDVTDKTMPYANWFEESKAFSQEAMNAFWDRFVATKRASTVSV